MIREVELATGWKFSGNRFPVFGGLAGSFPQATGFQFSLAIRREGGLALVGPQHSPGDEFGNLRDHGVTESLQTFGPVA